MPELITWLFSALGFVVGMILSLALIATSALVLGPLSAIVVTAIISIGFAAIFGLIGYKIALFTSESPFIYTDNPEFLDYDQNSKEEEDYCPCFSREFFKDPELEKLKKALKSYTKICQEQEIELQELNTTLSLIQEEWASLVQRSTLELDKLKKVNTGVCIDANTKTNRTDDKKIEQIVRINELVNHYPKLGFNPKTADEILEVERQRIMHHEELKNLVNAYLIENSATINLTW